MMSNWTRRKTLSTLGVAGIGAAGVGGMSALGRIRDPAALDRPPRIDMLCYGAAAKGDVFNEIDDVFEAARDGGLEAAVLDLGIYPRIPEGAQTELEALNELAAKDNAPFMIVREPTDFDRARQEGRVALVLGCQDAAILGSALEDFLARLEIFHDLGLRVLQLTHNRRTAFGDSYMERRDGGLSLGGVDLIRRMNALGMIVDLSHCSRLTLLDAIEVSERPCLVTHAGAFALAPTKRNKSDEEIRALARAGGVFGVFAMTLWLTKDGDASIDLTVDHIAYIADLVGAEHVGFGSDGHLARLDAEAERERMSNTQKEAAPGAPSHEWPVRHTRAPELNAPDRMNALADALRRRGFSDAEVNAITGGNFLRVFKEISGG